MNVPNDLQPIFLFIYMDYDNNGPTSIFSIHGTYILVFLPATAGKAMACNHLT